MWNSKYVLIACFIINHFYITGCLWYIVQWILSSFECYATTPDRKTKVDFANYALQIYIDKLSAAVLILHSFSSKSWQLVLELKGCGSLSIRFSTQTIPLDWLRCPDWLQEWWCNFYQTFYCTRICLFYVGWLVRWFSSLRSQ